MNCETWIMTLRSSDLQSDSDLDSIRNSCDVFYDRYGCIYRCEEVWWPDSMKCMHIWQFSENSSVLVAGPFPKMKSERSIESSKCKSLYLWFLTLLFIFTCASLPWALLKGHALAWEQRQCLAGWEVGFQTNIGQPVLLGWGPPNTMLVTSIIIFSWSLLPSPPNKATTLRFWTG